MVLPVDPAARRRVQRFCVSLALLWYARKTAQSFHDNHRLLLLQSEFQRGSRWTLAKGVARYTFVSQLIASMEYLIPLAKPVLALRIGRLLVWKGGDAVSNVVYGPHPRNTVDVYGVDAQAEPRKPVILFVHGGAWSYGHKWQYGLVGQYLATHGFLVGVINYRTYPTGSVHDQVQDVRDAIRWMHTHVEASGGDRNRIFLSGHSSGAHVGALTLAQSAAASGDGRVHHLIKGFIGLAGPYDITEHYEYESNRVVGPIHGVAEISTMKPAMLGNPHFDAVSPTKLFTQIRASAVAMPRFHILHGNADEVVPASSSKKLADNLRHAGHDVEYVELDGCTHEDILFSAMGDDVPTRDDVVAHYKRITQLPDAATRIAPTARAKL